MGPLTANAIKYGYLGKDEEISFIIAATMYLLFFEKYNHRYVLCPNSVFTVLYCLVSKIHFFPND